MALADYYARTAVAASQVIAGFDEQAFRTALEGACVGVSFDRDAAESREGQALLDLTVRLLTRLYPTIAVQPAPGAEEFAEHLNGLAKAINPRITIADEAAVGIAVGRNASTFDRTTFAGSSAWTAQLSRKTALAVGDSPVPFGAGTAACLAAAAVFRVVVLDDAADDTADLTFSCLDGVAPVPEPAVPDDGWLLSEPAVLIGCGAIGQATVWALARSPLRGDLFLVDAQRRRRGEDHPGRRPPHRHPQACSLPGRLGQLHHRTRVPVGDGTNRSRLSDTSAGRSGVAAPMDRECLDPAG